FGIARFARFETKTISGKVVGSVHYISPEQACGDVTDQKTDIYSVGVMLFEMLTGRLPFEADAAVSVAMMQVSKTPTRPRELNDTIPEGLEEIILKAMQKDTKARYQSAAEMLRDIDEFKKNPSIQFSYKYLNDDETPTRHFGAVNVETSAKNKEAEPEEEEETKSPMIPILLGITATVVVAVVVLLALLLPKIFSSTPAMEVPELVGMSITEAMEKYKEFDFSGHQTAYNDEYEEGIIFKQEIDAGQETKNPKLEVWVSLGAKKGEVPDVTEYQVSAAIDALKKAGFSNWTEIPEESSTVADGLVVRTFPQRGEEISLATTVQIFYSDEKLEKVQVPNVLDMNIEQATSILQAKGLVVGEPVQVASDKAKGVVVYQDVTPETWVDQGTTVTLKISSGEAQKTSYKMDIDIPDFITSEIEIKATLDGVTVKTSNIYASDIDKWSLT
ncbi:MAG: PASTA domain-containing protein, partial [Oscillospiraceae bacterium]|nr:PASTA domain-containing protein [Oscillospiraceae bacterium]